MGQGILAGGVSIRPLKTFMTKWVGALKCWPGKNPVVNANGFFLPLEDFYTSNHGTMDKTVLGHCSSVLYCLCIY